MNLLKQRIEKKINPSPHLSMLSTLDLRDRGMSKLLRILEQRILTLRLVEDYAKENFEK